MITIEAQPLVCEGNVRLTELLQLTTLVAENSP